MKRRQTPLLLVATVLLLLPLVPWPGSGEDPPLGAAQAVTGITHRLTSSVVGAGGCPGQSASESSIGTLGQSTPVGVGSTESEILYSGFWDRMAMFSAVDEEETHGGFNDVSETRLFQNTPNPFNPVTAIEYSILESGPVDLTIFSVSGEYIRTLVHRDHEPGLFSEVWDGKDESGRPVTSGVYFYRLTAKDYSEVRKMLILK